MKPEHEKLFTRLMRNTVLEVVNPNVEGLCKTWIGAVGRDGYGKASVREENKAGVKIHKKRRVHRLILEIVKEIKIPSRLHVDHICCNRKCIADYHLQVVTPKKNMRLRDKRIREGTNLNVQLTPQTQELLAAL